MSAGWAGEAEQVFSPASLTYGCGALWCAHYEYPLVVRVDPDTREAALWAGFGAGEAERTDTDAVMSGGPRAVATGLRAVWVLPSEGERLLQIDPGSGSVVSHKLPFPLTGIAAGPDAVFGIGEVGDGRVARFSPSAGVTAVSVGRALRLVATGEDCVWTVDDASATVIALDAHSLEPVRSFRHVGAPDALCADGRRAWYVCTAEIEMPAVDGRPRRAARLGPAGFTVELLRLDAATGSAERLCDLDGVAPQVALDAGRLWISGPRREGVGEDPVSALRCLDLDGQQVSVTELPGQIDAVAAGDTTVWVAGFRPSRQASILTALGSDGTVIGEVSFAHIDLGPWTPPPPPRAPRLPLPERARAVRDAVERALTEPVQAHGRFGGRWEEPPVSEAFRLERVELQGTSDAPTIAVLFRWSGENDLFGLSYPISQDDENDEAPDAYISVYVEENLLASGHGIANATREPAHGVTWLRWHNR